jgi:hypothetical protein
MALRAVLLAALLVPASVAPQADPVGTWKAVFTGPMGPRPQMVDGVVFTFRNGPKGLEGTAWCEPEWPGKLTVTDIKVEGDTVSFTGTGGQGSTANGAYSCCPRLLFTGTQTGDTMKLQMTWTSSANPDARPQLPVPMDATRQK